MDLRTLGREIAERITPDAAPAAGWWILLALLAALAGAVLPPLWRIARLAVTIVHELGHALIGVLVGRRFTGFVVSADMSGHAVTVGPRRGIGRVMSTWAGYPAPALVGAGLVQISLHGGARTALFAALAVLALSLVFTRSLHTLAAVLGTAAAVGALWWWGGAALTALLTLAGGAFLLLGAWRHLGAVISGGSRADDPAQLAQLTRVPAGAWTLSIAVALAGCTWWAWSGLSVHLPDLVAGLRSGA